MNGRRLVVIIVKEGTVQYHTTYSILGPVALRGYLLTYAWPVRLALILLSFPSFFQFYCMPRVLALIAL
jgi:hypothetical protein